MNKRIILAIGIALVSLSFMLVLYRSEQNVLLEPEYVLQIKDNTINLEVADTPDERKLGLSGRESINDNEGMFFIFPESDFHGIWMKDMNFSIDIIWLDEDFEVVNFKKDVSPDTYPTSFRPERPASYVIELLRGSIDKFSVKIGQQLEVSLKE